jgi:hypothetical protein
MRGTKQAYKILVGTSEKNRPLQRRMHRWQENIALNIKKGKY